MDIVVVVCAAFLVLYVATKGIMGSFPQVSGFWLPVDKKVDRETLGQASYADHLKKILPEKAYGCIYFSLDMQTWFLQNQLYPRMFSVVEESADINDCGLVISQFWPRTNPLLVEIDNFNGNYLYEVKGNVY